MKIEQRADRICDAIERSLPDALTAEPIVLDEANHRALIRDRMIHKVVPRPRRNDEKRLPWTISASALGVRGSRVKPRQSSQAISASSRSGERIGSGLRCIYDLAQVMVGPGVG